MGEFGGLARPYRALQARHLQAGGRSLLFSGRRMKSPVLMIHGAFCGPWSLEGLQQKFHTAGYSVTAPCLRFHDQAPPPAALGTTGLADYAADLEEEIRHLGEAPIVVGH